MTEKLEFIELRKDFRAEKIVQTLGYDIDIHTVMIRSVRQDNFMRLFIDNLLRYLYYRVSVFECMACDRIKVDIPKNQLLCGLFLGKHQSSDLSNKQLSSEFHGISVFGNDRRYLSGKSLVKTVHNNHNLFVECQIERPVDSSVAVRSLRLGIGTQYVDVFQKDKTFFRHGDNDGKVLDPTARLVHRCGHPNAVS
ncbi:hypothetical protein AGLY_007314 [Aphis glycines]|uniref:Uncharacterized protein n=1 Tax=Aphis glycines TaxID=307491 RepID=A0A6G0TPN9_APHGL|nr:hypothetical protein AGLY_007314 [Aphis glycines]